MAEFRVTGIDKWGYCLWTSPRHRGYRVATRSLSLLYVVERNTRGDYWEAQGIRGDFNGALELIDYLEMKEYADMYGNEFALMEG